jgi:hypothetical protein
MSDQEYPEDMDFDALSEDELSQMLGEAERALHDIRRELHERRMIEHAGLEVEMPRQDLNEARGRWAHFFEFVRHLTAQREGSSTG